MSVRFPSRIPRLRSLDSHPRERRSPELRLLSPLLLALSWSAAPALAWSAEAGPGDPVASASDTEVEPATLVVVADRLATARERTLQPVDVIDDDDRRDDGYPYQPIEPVADLPGTVLLQNGGIAGSSSLRLRGAPSYGTLILFDGIPLHDAAGTQMAPDLTVLNPAGIERTEVLRGPQSGLYGSRAIGGVVDFRPLRPRADHGGSGRLQVGSFATVDALVQAGGPLTDTVGYAVGATATSADGLSTLTSDDNGDPHNHEEDALERVGGYGRIEWQAHEAVSAFVSVDSMVAEAEFDSFTDPDDDDLFTEYMVTRLHTGARVDDPDGERFQLAADLAYTVYDREQPNASFGSEAWTGTELYASLRGRYQLLPLVGLAAGIDLRRDEADTELVGGGTSLDDGAEQIGGWLTAQVGQDWWDVAGTLRLDDHSEEGDAVTWQLVTRVDVLDGRIQLHAMAGSAFRAPSLFELFSQSDFGAGPIGNAELEAEDSFGAAVGHRSRLADGVILSNTWFRTGFDQRIDFDFASGYVNTDASERIDGVETELRLLADDERPIEIRITHTWMDFDHADGLERRLPENLLRAAFTWYAPRDVRFGAAFTAVDERSDGSATLAAYTLVDAAASWRIDETWEVFARGSNLTDEDYELADGFATPGIAGYLGGGAHW